MTKCIHCFIAFIALMLSGVTLSQDLMSMVGTWTGVSNAAVMGGARHHESAGENEPSMVKTELTLVVEKHEGRNWSGYVASSTDQEPVVGALRKDLKSGIYVDLDGMALLDRLGNDQLEVCYGHATSTANGSSVAACLVFTRQ